MLNHIIGLFHHSSIVLVVCLVLVLLLFWFFLKRLLVLIPMLFIFLLACFVILSWADPTLLSALQSMAQSMIPAMAG